MIHASLTASEKTKGNERQRAKSQTPRPRRWKEEDERGNTIRWPGLTSTWAARLIGTSVVGSCCLRV